MSSVISRGRGPVLARLPEGFLESRVPLKHPLTARQVAVLELIAARTPLARVARQLSLSIRTVHRHCDQIAAKIPGTLPRVARLRVWYSGGSRASLG